MAYANGRLPDSALSPIAGGRLRHDAAACWNAMNKESRKKYGVTLLPAGSLSSYRNLAGQRYLYKITRAGWAAYPGTSNHGWGTTVDVASHQMRSIIDNIGRKYGFSKACSDASWEWWHIRFNPSCTGASGKRKDPGPNGNGATVELPTLRKGTHGHPRAVKLAKRCLNHLGYSGIDVRSAHYDFATRRAVRLFQHKHHLHADGICGARTWKKLLKHRPK